MRYDKRTLRHSGVVRGVGMIPPPLRCIQRSAEDWRAGETDSGADGQSQGPPQAGPGLSGARGVVDLAARPIRSVTKRSAERLKAPRSPCAPSLLPYLQTVGGNFMKHTVALKQNHEFRRLYSKGKSAVSPIFCHLLPQDQAAQTAGLASPLG